MPTSVEKFRFSIKYGEFELNQVHNSDTVLYSYYSYFYVVLQYRPGEDIRPPVVDFSAPPPYEMPMKLPTYEEVQREKALEGELLPTAVSVIKFLWMYEFL